MPDIDEASYIKTPPREYQRKALELSKNKKNFAYFMEMGCVDGETEFLSNRGWIKFKDFKLNDWEAPLLVAQVEDSTYDETPYRKIMSFVPPISYIQKSVESMYYFHSNRRGHHVNMMLSHDHRWVGRYRRSAGCGKRKDSFTYGEFLAGEVGKTLTDINRSWNRKDDSFDVLQRCWMYDGVVGYSYPKGSNPIAELDEWLLRIQVAIIADGHFPNKNDNKCVFEFAKERKVERLLYLCKKAHILAVKQNLRKKNTVRISIIAPDRTKYFDERFWTLPPMKHHQIFDEVFNWDGYIDGRGELKKFYSTNKQSADFVQFLCVTHGYYAHLSQMMKNDKPYYTVSYNPAKGINSNWNVQKGFVEPDVWSGIRKSEKIKGPMLAYCFRVPSGQLLLRRRNEVFVTGNSGKTKVMIDNMAYLSQIDAITGAVIFAPKGVYRNWAEIEIPKHLSDNVQRQVLVWKAEASAGYKRKLVEAIKQANPSVLQILVFNVESLTSDSGKKVVQDFLKQHNNNVLGIVDESTCIKNHKAKRTKSLIEIGQKCKVRRIATGSPITNSPLDIYSQMAFLDKRILGHGSYYSFRNTYANVEKVPTRQGLSYPKIVNYKNLDRLSKDLAPFSFRITKKECLDLPDKVYMTRSVELTPEQITIYNQLKSLSMATFNSEIMSAQIVLTKILRLHQVLCGCYTSDSGEVIPVPNKRIDALEETLEELSGKTIIWANYLQNIHDIEKFLSDKYGKDSFVTYIGSTTPDERQAAINSFQDENSPVKFFIGNVQTAGRGITLTAASNVIYFSNNYSLEMRQQSEDRAHRLGQKNKVTYIDLVVRGSIDEKIIRALLAKRDIANEILHDDLGSWIDLS